MEIFIRNPALNTFEKQGMLAFVDHVRPYPQSPSLWEKGERACFVKCILILKSLNVILPTTCVSHLSFSKFQLLIKYVINIASVLSLG